MHAARGHGGGGGNPSSRRCASGTLLRGSSGCDIPSAPLPPMAPGPSAGFLHALEPGTRIRSSAGFPPVPVPVAGGIAQVPGCCGGKRVLRTHRQRSLGQGLGAAVGRVHPTADACNAAKFRRWGASLLIGQAGGTAKAHPLQLWLLLLLFPVSCSRLRQALACIALSCCRGRSCYDAVGLCVGLLGGVQLLVHRPCSLEALVCCRPGCEGLTHRGQGPCAAEAALEINLLGDEAADSLRMSTGWRRRGGRAW